MKLLNIGNSFINTERIDAIKIEILDFNNHAIVIYIGNTKVTAVKFTVPSITDEDITVKIYEAGDTKEKQKIIDDITEKREKFIDEKLQNVYEYISKFGE